MNNCPPSWDFLNELPEAEQMAFLEKMAPMARPLEANWDLDFFSRQAIRAVSTRTMTSTMKMAALIDAIRYLSANRIMGDVVECGVWRGGSAMLACLTMQQLNDYRTLHLFDTFSGMTPPTEFDVQERDGRLAADILSEQPRNSFFWAIASLEDVKGGLGRTRYPKDLFHYNVGDVRETLPGWTGDIALLRLDTDWYESTRCELEHLYDQVVPGGVVIVDDYGAWRGSRKAVDEFFEKRKMSPMLFRADEARIFLKV